MQYLVGGRYAEIMPYVASVNLLHVLARVTVIDLAC